MQDNDPVRK